MISSSGDIKRAKIGQLTANGTNVVTLPVRGLQADSYVVAQLNTPSGTVAGFILTQKTPGANSNSNGTIGFSSAAGNTSVYDIYVFV